MRQFSASIAALTATACATASAAPSAEQFMAIHASQCADHAAKARKARCHAVKEEPTEFQCSYKLPELDGSWKTYRAIVARDGANWVWLDGETRCAISAISNLN